MVTEIGLFAETIEPAKEEAVAETTEVNQEEVKND